jgi:oligoendopeptidase F
MQQTYYCIMSHILKKCYKLSALKLMIQTGFKEGAGMVRSFMIICSICLMVAACGVQESGVQESGVTGGGDEGSVQALKERSEIADEFKWKLEDIYSTNDDWEKEFEAVKAEMPNLSTYNGRLGESAATLLQYFRAEESAELKLERLLTYAGMRSHQDTRETSYQGLNDRINSLVTQFNGALAFVQPELMEVPESKLRGFLKSNKDLALYEHKINDLLRAKKHTLSKTEEELLALGGDVFSGPANIFNMLNNADLKFPVIQDEQGNDIELTKGNFGVFLESPNRDIRRAAFEGVYSAYRAQINTITATYGTQMKKDVMMARARKYNSPMESALHPSNIPPLVYTNLIEAVNENLAPLRRYVKLRKKILGITDLHHYDVYTPLFSAGESDYPIEEGKKLVLEHLSMFGDKYLQLLDKGMNGGWVDVYENVGKRAGAYKWGPYGTHPFVLLNYTNKLNDVLTLAHEMGHAMHSSYSQANQSYTYGDYTLFLAEVASTANEAVMMNGLISVADDKQQKLVLLNQWLDNIVGTFYRQTMFAEFELFVHDAVSDGQPLTSEWLGEQYGQLYERYYGETYVVDEDLKLEWARIPHFYRNFYVFKYATGYAASQALANAIIEEGQPAVDRYLKFISLGSSDYSINLLKTAGVDMTTKKPIEDVARLMDRLLDEVEASM